MMEINLRRPTALRMEPELTAPFDLLDRSLRRVFFQAVGSKVWKYPAIYIKFRLDGKEKVRAIPIRSYVDKLAARPVWNEKLFLTDPYQWFVVSKRWTPIRPPTA